MKRKLLRPWEPLPFWVWLLLSLPFIAFSFVLVHTNAWLLLGLIAVDVAAFTTGYASGLLDD